MPPTESQTIEPPVRRGAANADAPARTLVHETWGDHAALLARTRAPAGGSVGRVQPKVLDVVTPSEPLRLQRGGLLPAVAVAYEEYGRRNAAGDNTVLVCHALTGSAHAAGVGDREEVPGWWDPLIGPGKAIDTDRFHVLSTNVLGGCYGTTGPSSLDPATGRPYGPNFPRYTVRDMVEVQKRLLDKLGITSLRAVVGGSMGGMQVLEWGAMYPEMVRSLVPIAIGSRHSAWAIGLNEVARRAITSDPAWRGGEYRIDQQPEVGLGLARAIAMLTYRSHASVEERFGRDRFDNSRSNGQPGSANGQAGSALEAPFEITSYLAYQGVKLVKRFDANTYLYLTLAMDDYDIGEDRGGAEAVLNRLDMPALVLGIDTDVLYPEREAKAVAERLPKARYARISSPHGHDAFLIEFDQVSAHLRRFFQS